MSDYQVYTPPAPTGLDASGLPYGQQPGSGMPLGAGQQAYPMVAYQASPYPGVRMGALPEHPQATTVLVLGILGLVLSGILGPFAWYFGNKAKKECDAGMYAMSGSLSAGRICGIIATVILAVAVVFVVLGLVGMLALARTPY